MTNLIVLANLFDINLKEMLKEIQQTLQKDLPFYVIIYYNCEVFFLNTDFKIKGEFVV